MKQDFIGRKFGRWNVVNELPKRGEMRMFLCECDCGNFKNIQMSSLTTGRSTSCGCYKKEENIHRLTKVGRSEKNKHTGEYNSWAIMIQRCTNVNHERYNNYGGRGIKVCERWLSFDNFLQDMGKRPSINHSIDRYPNINGDYEPSNCRWATRHQQYRGKTNNRWVECNGVKMIICDWAKYFGVSLTALHYHLKNGRSFEWIVEFYKKKNNGNI